MKSTPSSGASGSMLHKTPQGNSFAHQNIVSRGDWLGKPAHFKGACLCLRFSMSRDIYPAQLSKRLVVKCDSRSINSSQFHRVFSCLKVYIFATNSKYFIHVHFSEMPGENCAVWGCGSCRRTKGIGIFKLPKARDAAYKEWRDAWLAEITKTRTKNQDFQDLIDKDRVYTCEKHF